MEPYDNKNKNDWIISYVVPIYRNEDFIGVLGMDIDMALLKEKVDSVQIYESGYAFLAGADYVIYYHRDYPEGLDEENTHGKIRKVLNLLYKKGTQDNLVGYNLDGIKKKMTARQLEMVCFLLSPHRQRRSMRRVTVLSDCFWFQRCLSSLYRF